MHIIKAEKDGIVFSHYMLGLLFISLSSCKEMNQIKIKHHLRVAATAEQRPHKIAGKSL